MDSETTTVPDDPEDVHPGELDEAAESDDPDLEEEEEDEEGEDEDEDEPDGAA